MLIPNFEEVQKCTASIWQEEEYQQEILWAGVFGSVSRKQAREDSDVDFLIVLKGHHTSPASPIDLQEKLAEACGRKISLVGIWQGPDWASGHIRVEALLSSRTVYGNRADIEHLRREGIALLECGFERLRLVAQAVEKIKGQVAAIQTYENFIHPAYQSANQECIQEVVKVVDWLDIQPFYHPVRTMLRHSVKHIESIRDILDKEPGKVWELIQPTSQTMRDFTFGSSVLGPKCILQMLALQRLMDRFEEGGEVDDDMYKDIFYV